MANKKLKDAKKRYAELKKQRDAEKADSVEPEGEDSNGVEAEIAESMESKESTAEPLERETEAAATVEENPQNKEPESVVESVAETKGTKEPVLKEQEPEPKPKQSKSETETASETTAEPAQSKQPEADATQPKKSEEAKPTTPTDLSGLLEDQVISLQEENDLLRAKIQSLENKVNKLETELSQVRAGSEDDFGPDAPAPKFRAAPDLYSESFRVDDIKASMESFASFQVDMRAWQYMSGIGPLATV